MGIWALGYDDGSNKLWNALKEKMGGKTVPSIPVNYNVTNIGNGVVALDFQNTKSANSFSVQQIFHDSNKTEDLGTFSGTPILLQNLSLGIPYYIKIKADRKSVV